MIDETNFPHKDEYTHLWATMDINKGRVDDFQQAANTILKGKEIYLSIQETTNVPWDMIGLIHYRESNCNFNTHLHNGDSLRKRTVNVPSGRPKTGNPPFQFTESAIDALQYDGLDKITNWSIELRAYFLERYNGFGYRNKGINSPYLWAGTDNYINGKFYADGKYSSTIIDKQLGCMGILFTLFDLDKSIVQTSNITEALDCSYKAEPIETLTNLPEISRKWRIYDLLHKFFIWVGGIFTAIVSAFEGTDIPTAKSYLDQAKELWVSYGPISVVALCFIGYVTISKLKTYTKEDITNGTYKPSGS